MGGRCVVVCGVVNFWLCSPPCVVPKYNILLSFKDFSGVKFGCVVVIIMSSYAVWPGF